MTRDELVAAGFPVSRRAHALLARYLELLLAETERVNLTAIRDVADAWALHICDSLALVPLIQQRAPATLLDLGTGGGVPGIPIACALPELRVTLLDARRKKVEALERMLEQLGLPNATAVWGRAEQLAEDARYRERFDAVAARAVGKLGVALARATGLVRPDGDVWVFQSVAAAEREPPEVAQEAGERGLRLMRQTRYSLPGGHGERVITTYGKRRSVGPRGRRGGARRSGKGKGSARSGRKGGRRRKRADEFGAFGDA